MSRHPEDVKEAARKAMEVCTQLESQMDLTTEESEWVREVALKAMELIIRETVESHARFKRVDLALYASTLTFQRVKGWVDHVRVKFEGKE